MYLTDLVPGEIQRLLSCIKFYCISSSKQQPVRPYLGNKQLKEGGDLATDMSRKKTEAKWVTRQCLERPHTFSLECGLREESCSQPADCGPGRAGIVWPLFPEYLLHVHR